MMVLWGLVSPQLLQKVMALYKADLELLEAGRLDVSGIHKMARLGDHGNLPNHCWRDLKAILPVVKLPKLQVVSGSATAPPADKKVVYGDVKLGYVAAVQQGVAAPAPAEEMKAGEVAKAKKGK